MWYNWHVHQKFILICTYVISITVILPRDTHQEDYRQSLASSPAIKSNGLTKFRTTICSRTYLGAVLPAKEINFVQLIQICTQPYHTSWWPNFSQLYVDPGPWCSHPLLHSPGCHSNAGATVGQRRTEGKSQMQGILLGLWFSRCC